MTSLRNYIVHHGITEFWRECLEAVVRSERFQRELLSSFAEENYELFLLLTLANKKNALDAYEKPLQGQLSRLVELADSPKLRDLLMRELKNPHWREAIERHD